MTTTLTYKETYRPQFHFSPEKNWMNDPNGMVYFEGEYHLFYQYHPFSTVWGPMHWGHAVSKDMIHWEHLPIALYPDELGAIFSGSCVVDHNNSTGFFNGEKGLVAIFTHADGPKQRQSIAYSHDCGRTWTKYEGNPVLVDENYADFRDPKVFWNEEMEKWVMILAAGNHVRLYISRNLIDWEFASEFGHHSGSHDGVWECPDLFELPVGETGLQKWVMIVSIGSDDAHIEGSRTQYFIGEFDGKVFKNDNPDETVLWVDHGRDNYAGVTFSDSPDGRKVYMGWMSNWKYANMTPTKEWRSAMTLPRELRLASTKEGIRLIQLPATEIESLRKEKRGWTEQIIDQSGMKLPHNIIGKTCEIIAEFELGSATEFGISVLKSENEETMIGYDVKEQKLFFDRRFSGDASFYPLFACKHGVEMEPRENRISLHLFVDWSSVEVFANNGEVAMTDLTFSNHASQELMLVAKGGDVKLNSLLIYELESSWT